MRRAASGARLGAALPSPQNPPGPSGGEAGGGSGGVGGVGGGGGAASPEGDDPGWRTVSFNRVFVASPPDLGGGANLGGGASAAAVAAAIQGALERGLDVVLSPGLYPLSAPLEIRTPNQV